MDMLICTVPTDWSHVRSVTPMLRPWLLAQLPRPQPRPSAPSHACPQVKPPICFTEQQADRMVDAMAAMLAALTPEDKARLAEASRAEVEAVAERHARLG